MKAVVQRVRGASVRVDGAVKGSINSGLLVYLGVARDDTLSDARWLAEKIVNMRIFDDAEGKMNLSLMDIIANQQDNAINDNNVNFQKEVVNDTTAEYVNHKNNEVNNVPIGVLAVSQFTLLGDARKGRRPSWEKAAPPEQARELYRRFIEAIREKTPCECGEFQAHMQVSSTNDGPVTILLDSSTSPILLAEA